MPVTRREILIRAGGVIAATASASSESKSKTRDGHAKPAAKSESEARAFNGVYHGNYLNQIAFPLGGIGAGMFCLEGAGALTKFSLRNRPELGNEPHAFAAVCVGGSRNLARVLEGPVPAWKLKPFLPGVEGIYPGGCWGLPRFRQASFESKFPFGTVRLNDEMV